MHFTNTSICFWIVLLFQPHNAGANEEWKFVYACFGQAITEWVCPPGELIHLEGAEYGESTTQGDTTCVPKDTDCTYEDIDYHDNKVIQQCDGKPECNNTFVDERWLDCDGNRTTSNYLIVYYTCKEKGNTDLTLPAPDYPYDGSSPSIKQDTEISGNSGVVVGVTVGVMLVILISVSGILAVIYWKGYRKKKHKASEEAEATTNHKIHPSDLSKKKGHINGKTTKNDLFWKGENPLKETELNCASSRWSNACNVSSNVVNTQDKEVGPSKMDLEEYCLISELDSQNKDAKQTTDCNSFLAPQSSNVPQDTNVDNPAPTMNSMVKIGEYFVENNHYETSEDCQSGTVQVSQSLQDKTRNNKYANIPVLETDDCANHNHEIIPRAENVYINPLNDPQYVEIEEAANQEECAVPSVQSDETMVENNYYASSDVTAVVSPSNLTCRSCSNDSQKDAEYHGITGNTKALQHQPSDAVDELQENPYYDSSDNTTTQEQSLDAMTTKLQETSSHTAVHAKSKDGTYIYVYQHFKDEGRERSPSVNQ